MNKDRMLLGEGLKISDKLEVKHPTLREVILLEDIYLNYLEYFVFRTQDYMVWLYDRGINYYDISEYDIFLKMFEFEEYNNSKNIHDSLNWWFNGNFNFKLQQAFKNKMGILFCSETQTVFDMRMYENMSKYIKCINNITNENKYSKPGENLLKKLVKKEKERIERKKNKPLKKYSGYLYDIVNSIAWANHGVNIYNIWDLKLYQFYSGFNKILQIKEVENNNRVLASGNVSKDIRPLVDWIYESSWLKEIERKNTNMISI